MNKDRLYFVIGYVSVEVSQLFLICFVYEMICRGHMYTTVFLIVVLLYISTGKMVRIMYPDQKKIPMKSIMWALFVSVTIIILTGIFILAAFKMAE
jgi:hypothetical protein